MPYSTNVACLLTDQLVKFVTLNRHQLAGQVGNLDFWMAEVRHALGVIDGYGPRFERLRSAHQEYIAEHGARDFRFFDPCHPEQDPAPPRRIPHSELNAARRPLCEAAYRFLIRCFNEGIITESVLRDTCGNLGVGIEARDLRSRA